MKKEEQQYNILVYGIEIMGLYPPIQEISNRNYKLSFDFFSTEKRFNDFDGIILFQGIFETYKGVDRFDGQYLKPSYNRNELDKRKKELSLLLEKGGFICFILHSPFKDSHYQSGHKRQYLSGTDLSKYCLNLSSFYRKDFSERTTDVYTVRDEFKRFIEKYGAAWTHFENYNENIELREIAKVNNAVVGMILFDSEFFVPSLVPENQGDRIFEYFSILAEAVSSSFNKLRFELPSWVADFRFKIEAGLISEKEKLIPKINFIDTALAKYAKYKKILIGSGEVLVEHVADVLREGFAFDIDTDDNLREDLKILNEQKEPMIFIEVKGTNRGVKREFINQVDSHRDRAGHPSTFPSLLIVNTHIKNSNSISDKEQLIADEQIKHASKIGILVLRTLDLFYLLHLKELERVTSEKILEIFKTNVGWLKAGLEDFEILE